MKISNYKRKAKQALNEERNTQFNNQFDELRLQLMDEFSESNCRIINSFILSALVKFHEEDYNGYFEQVNLVISFLNELHEASIDFTSLLPKIFNLDFNICLIKSTNPEQYHIQNINEALSLISLLSAYSKNYDFFQNSSIFEITLNLLRSEDEVLFHQSIIVMNIFFTSYNTLQIQPDLSFLVKILRRTSENILFSDHCIISLNKIIPYVNKMRYLNEIVYIINRILLKCDFISTFNNIIETIQTIFDMDPLNFQLIFQSQIIQNFMDLIIHKFIKNPDYYQTMEHFFNFIKHSFENIDSSWQERTIKVIGLDSLIKIFEKVHDNKILFIIHLIFFQYMSDHSSIEDIYPYIAYITEIGLISKLIMVFNDQTFKVKKLILNIIKKLVNTRSQEIFSQLLKNDEINYFDICADFVPNNDDIEIQITFLESVMALTQISELTDEKYLISSSQFAYDFIWNCLTSEDKTVQELSKELFEMINSNCHD